MNQIIDRSLRVIVGQCRRRQFDPCDLDQSLGRRSESLLSKVIYQISLLRQEAEWLTVSESGYHRYTLEFSCPGIGGCHVTIAATSHRAQESTFTWTYELKLCRVATPDLSMCIWSQFEGYQHDVSEVPVDEAFLGGCVHEETAWRLRDLWRAFAMATPS